MSYHDTLIAPARAPADRHTPANPAVGAPLADGRPPLTGDRRAAGEAAPSSHTTVLGRYLLIERLGAGGFGVVWRAHDQLLDREVAVKMIPLPAGEDHERATREALATARLAHPAIVALYEACAHEDTFYLISELVHGKTLAQLIAADELGDEEAIEIGLALADALLHAHERGVVHRDIKPQNVLVSLGPEDCSPTTTPTPPGSAPIAKLTDFGGALIAGEETLTRTGDVLGTLAYMAPEQIDGEEVAESADLYSLALVLYEALTGVNPVRGPTPAATVRQIGAELPRLERYRRDLPRELTRAVAVALDPRPERRGTLSELRDALTLARGAPRRSLHGGGAPVERPLPRELSERSVSERPERAGWSTPSRLLWLAAGLAVCVWQLATARPGVALVVPCAVLPLVLLVRRPGPRWLLAALAPLLGLAGLAAAYPALAGQLAHWRVRVLLGALGYWWLRLSELPLGGATAALHSMLSLPSTGLLLGAGVWSAAAAVLPRVVPGRSAKRDVLGAVVWACALAAAVPLLDRGLSLAGAALPSPRGVILGVALGAVIAVVARALRGPVPTIVA